MEKKRARIFVLAKPALTAIFLLIMLQTYAQKMKTVPGHCGSFYVSMDHLRKVKEPELDFYDFRAGQTVASIGAQCCHWEAAFAATTDSIMFYLEDIDTTKFTKEQADFVWSYYGKLRGRPMTSTFKMIVGNEKATALPENSCDKILIINSFHEFTYQAAMLADIKKKLKQDGILYIDEALPKKTGQLHGICNLPMLTSKQMNEIFSENGFEYINGIEFNYRQNNPVRKVYAFKIKRP